ncbi:MAG TPA: indole-3-glycerol phosphate synthase, partial [Solirubrobacterales bacterium]|nr:indole-3-glycerol phosphate synthase [Solirubrobacterales bacterium]
VEVHDEDELERALEAGAEVIGINNRNLDEGSVDVATTYELMPDVPAGKTVVAESGISAREELAELERVGVDAVLIGGALMSSPDPEAKVRELTGWDEGTREHLV